MSAVLAVFVTSLGCLLYVLIGLHIGMDIAIANRGMLMHMRVSPWLRGALWPFYVVLGIAITLIELSGPRAKR